MYCKARALCDICAEEEDTDDDEYVDDKADWPWQIVH